jgi:hypothetical protein
MKSLIILLMSLSDTTMTIDSHNWHFIFDHLLVLCKNIEQAHINRDGFDILLNAVDVML